MVDTRDPSPDPVTSGTDQTAPRTMDLRPSATPARGLGRPPATEPPRTRPPIGSMADLLLGTVLADRYKLLTKLGEGAMGWVFLAEHTEIGKKLAVKVMRPSLCRLPEAVRRFRREARAATQVGSKHIVDVTDFGTTPNGAVFFVMEYLEGGEDLGTLLKKQGKLPWPRVQHIMIQLCDALQAAHDTGIIHRDVKPANFYRVDMAGDHDFIKVLDFGIARLANPTDSIVTQTGVVMGTPDYMAPEQAQGRHVDHRADIYSLGATAYALLTAGPPFSGKNEYDVIYKHLNETPRPPSSIARDLPDWVDGVIKRAMAKEPEQRYQSMAEFAAALRGPSSQKADAAAKSNSRAPVIDNEPQHGISPAALALGALGLALVGGLIVYFAFG
ncbi:MAG: serine/threonine protein kinase [Deltaproteobacteria bacterium]|jgi:serine/threonine protein kinase|nr:serine/threonine protein kinase [Deltaproteobacteria bacterium]MBK8235654.1 serine/threonine protein kinase [Deltaproteobacteria bacterium]MBK8713290.1 serine/threonine protein kinase [Deltaproteobacteria bacterium]MBP7292305.1 serine/threonine protein kinase [Nannocystaceae bacterium]